MDRRAFSKYKNKVLVETGTHIGDGIIDALNNNFEQIISFEVVDTFVQQARQKFQDNKNVSIIHGSSASLLFDSIKDIQCPITFWLDGHYSHGNTGYDSTHKCPLIQELDQISKHHLNTHTILIDDRRVFGTDTEYFNVSEDEIIVKLKSINKDYIIKYEDGHIPNDIIVATL